MAGIIVFFAGRRIGLPYGKSAVSLSAMQKTRLLATGIAASLTLILAACSAGNADDRTARTPEARTSAGNGAGNGSGSGTGTVIHDPLAKADRIVVDKSDRVMILYKQDKVIARYADIKLGDAPVGHKQFEGDEKTPEGNYTINGRNPGSSYHLSLRVSYPNAADRAYAKSKGRSPGGDIFIHGQPNGSPAARLPHDWTDGCIALSNAEIKVVWKQVADGTAITIRP